MKPKEELSFGIIGSGNVASHLAPTLVANGAKCTAVYSPTLAHATSLATKINAKATEGLGTFIDTCSDQAVDFILVSIKDDALPKIGEAFPKDFSPLVLHTSGSTKMEVFKELPNHGVLYPMQTFSKARAVEVSQVPFFIEANSEQNYRLIDQIAEKLLHAKNTTRLSSEDRGRLHLASVFACNFVNRMYDAASEVMELAGLDFELLLPLIHETMEKATTTPPKQAQTGPAVRKDQLTMQRHLELLEQHADLRELYTVISQSIIHRHHNE